MDPSRNAPAPRGKLFGLAITALVALTTHAEGADLGLETVAREYARSHDYHGTVLVERRGVLLYREDFGLADREFDVPVQPDTKFKIASITKTFTATLILQLRDEGKLKLEAPFKTYLPKYPGAGVDAITVHQPLNHTSGLGNYDTILPYEEAEKRGLDLYQLPHTTDQLLDTHAKGKIAHEPGKVFDYNNADYVILGKIIEALAGKPYEDVLRERILSPLGMTDSGMLHHHAITKRLARTYWRPKGVQEMTNDWPFYYENWYAAGGMYSTATDLRKFSAALFGGKLLKPDSLELMLQPGLDEYGYGAWVSSRKFGEKTDRVFERFGSILGINCILAHTMDADITIILLSNTNVPDLGDFSARLGQAVAASPKD